MRSPSAQLEATAKGNEEATQTFDSLLGKGVSERAAAQRVEPLVKLRDLEHVLMSLGLSGVAFCFPAAQPQSQTSDVLSSLYCIVVLTSAAALGAVRVLRSGYSSCLIPTKMVQSVERNSAKGILTGSALWMPSSSKT